MVNIMQISHISFGFGSWILISHDIRITCSKVGESSPNNLFLAVTNRACLKPLPVDDTVDGS